MASNKQGNQGDDNTHTFKHPISNGPNARPRDESIASTGVGLPDDSSSPADIDAAKEERIAAKILDKPQG